jgi:hypothetical protein
MGVLFGALFGTLFGALFGALLGALFGGGFGPGAFGGGVLEGLPGGTAVGFALEEEAEVFAAGIAVFAAHGHEVFAEDFGGGGGLDGGEEALHFDAAGEDGEERRGGAVGFALVEGGIEGFEAVEAPLVAGGGADEAEGGGGGGVEVADVVFEYGDEDLAVFGGEDGGVGGHEGGVLFGDFGAGFDGVFRHACLGFGGLGAAAALGWRGLRGVEVVGHSVLLFRLVESRKPRAGAGAFHSLLSD